jgi:hypothetical protein
MPTTAPSMRAKPVRISLANRGLISNHEPASTSSEMIETMSKALFSLSGISDSMVLPDDFGA